MKFSTSLLALVLAAVTVEASTHGARDTYGGHARHARRLSESDDVQVEKRCKARSLSSNTAPASSSFAASSSSSSVAAATSPAATPATTSSAVTAAATSPAATSAANDAVSFAASGVSEAVSGLIAVTSGSCGASGATKDITATSGPNGALEWLNCGLDNSGWNPPYIQVSDLVYIDLSEAIQDPNSPFTACAAYVDLFNTYAWQNGLPPILVASFAMQESSCNPNQVGGAGEQGLMQLTKDKCTQAPGGNCQDPDYNIKTGAAFIATTLANNGGDVLKTIGNYNGWYTGLTIWEATAAATTSCCRCQNNCDYLHQFLNGWMQNIDAYTYQPRLGKYFNLDQCGSW